VRQDCSFAKKQESPSALLVVVRGESARDVAQSAATIAEQKQPTALLLVVA
jgi:hypothetical protein